MTTTKDPAMTDREAARRAVRRAVEATQLGIYGFAEKAKIDPGTLRDFLDGTRWPQSRNRSKIERTLGWADGTIADMADGLVQMPAPPQSSTAEAIANDPDLHPVARAHLLNQYEILRQLPATLPPELEAIQEERRAQAAGPHPEDVAVARVKLAEVKTPPEAKTRRSVRTKQP